MNKVIFFLTTFICVLKINSQITITPVKQNGPVISESDTVIKIYGVLPLNANHYIDDGHYESYYLDGPLSDTWTIKNGRVVGDYFKYYESGTLKTKIQYGNVGCSSWPGEIDEGCSAVQTLIEENGDTVSIYSYTSGNDSLTNLQREKYWMMAEYYPNHMVEWISWEISSEDSAITINSFFHPKVRPDLSKYISSEYFGINNYSVHCFYNGNGTLVKFFECNQSVRYNGKYLLFYDDGKPKLISQYKDDKLNGKYQEFYENGQIKIEAFLEAGKYAGEYKQYSKKGKLIKSTTY